MQDRIDRRRYPSNLSLEHSVWVGEDSHLHRIAQVNVWRVFFAHIGEHPYFGQVANLKLLRRAAGGGTDDVLTEAYLALNHDAIDRCEDDAHGIEFLHIRGLLDSVDFRIGLAQNTEPVADRGETDLSRIEPALRVGEIDLALLPVFLSRTVREEQF